MCGFVCPPTRNGRGTLQGTRTEIWFSVKIFKQTNSSFAMHSLTLSLRLCLCRLQRGLLRLKRQKWIKFVKKGLFSNNLMLSWYRTNSMKIICLCLLNRPQMIPLTLWTVSTTLRRDLRFWSRNRTNFLRPCSPSPYRTSSHLVKLNWQFTSWKIWLVQTHFSFE